MENIESRKQELARKISCARNLENLCAALNAAEDFVEKNPPECGGGIEQALDIDLSGLQVWGECVVPDTTGIYSWEGRTVLVPNPSGKPAWIVEYAL